MRRLRAGLSLDGLPGELPDRPGPGHGAQLLLRVHGVRAPRRRRFGTDLAARPRGGLPVGLLPDRGLGGPPARADRARHSRLPEARHRRGDRTVDRHARPAVGGDRRRRSRAGADGRAGVPRHVAGPVRDLRHGRAGGLGPARGAAHGNGRHAVGRPADGSGRRPRGDPLLALAADRAASARLRRPLVEPALRRGAVRALLPRPVRHGRHPRRRRSAGGPVARRRATAGGTRILRGRGRDGGRRLAGHLDHHELRRERRRRPGRRAHGAHQRRRGRSVPGRPAAAPPDRRGRQRSDRRREHAPSGARAGPARRGSADGEGARSRSTGRTGRSPCHPSWR